MSWKAMAYVIEIDVGVTHTEKFLLFNLAYYHNDETYRCDPSVSRLSKMTLLTERTIQRTLRSLHRKDFIRIRERSGRSNQYDLQWTTSGVDVTPDTMSPLTQGHPTSGVDVTQTLGTLSSLEELRSSSSGAEDEEPEFSIGLKTWYHIVDQAKQGLRSPLKAASRYFNTLQKNGDAPPPFKITDAALACNLIRDAMCLDWPEGDFRRGQTYTVPMPNQLSGMVRVAEELAKWSSSRASTRMAVMNFLHYVDPEMEPVDAPATVLGLIAQQPEQFAQAVENAAREG